MSGALLQVSGVRKFFHGVPVLKDVSFRVRSGESVGIVGENGAGKSTLLRILSGILAQDDGQLLLESKSYAPQGANDARELGVALVHQELNLFTNLTVAENLLLTSFPCRGKGLTRWIDRRAARDEALAALRRIGLNVSPDVLVSKLSPGERQLLEIAKALHQRPKIILLDEPTTSLTVPEADRLFQIIDDLKREGFAVVYVSHNLGDVMRICDSIVVLRDGEVQSFGASSEFDLERMISLMVGRQITQVFPQRASAGTREPVLEVKGLTQPGVVRNVSFALHRGEVLGLSGLMGSGRTELARILFGLDSYAAGKIRVQHEGIIPAPRRCIMNGIALLTESRRDDGLLMDSAIEDNVVLASLPRFARRWSGWFRRRKASDEVDEAARRMALSCRSTKHQPVRTLSGGNQQKVVLAKWLMTEPSVVILDEPTRGVDVAAKVEIYQMINELVARGAGVLMISSELEELLGMCDRILVMAAGEIRREVHRDKFDRQSLIREALGQERLR